MVPSTGSIVSINIATDDVCESQSASGPAGTRGFGGIVACALWSYILDHILAKKMNPLLTPFRPEPAANQRAPRSASRRLSARRSANARVTVAWTPSIHELADGWGATEVELEALLATGAPTTWTCREPCAPDWVELISSAHCSEVVLTARLGDDAAAKHLVLDLAERLAFELASSRPLIRVLFQ